MRPYELGPNPTELVVLLERERDLSPSPDEDLARKRHLRAGKRDVTRTQLC